MIRPFFERIPSKKHHILAGIGGGLAGSAAYALAQQLDLKAFGNNTDDFVLLGRLFSRDADRIQVIGGVVHFVNGSALGALYGLVGHDAMPGPPLTKGLAFALLETALLYPMATLERFHPGIQEGSLEPYTTPVAFAQQVVRHVAYGAALGPVTDLLLQKR